MMLTSWSSSNRSTKGTCLLISIREIRRQVSLFIYLFFHGLTALVGPGLLVDGISRSHSMTHARTLSLSLFLGRNPLDDGSARRRDLYQEWHNTQNRQKAIPLTGFQLSVPARERPQSHALDRKATGIGSFFYWHVEISHFYCLNISSLYGSTDKAPTDIAVQEGRVVRRSMGVGGKRTEH